MRGRVIGEDAELTRRIVEACKLEPRIELFGLCAASASRLQVSKEARMSARRLGSSTTTKRHGWLKPTEGERQAMSISRSMVAAGTIALEAPHVAPSREQLMQPRTEIRVEVGVRCDWLA